MRLRLLQCLCGVGKRLGGDSAFRPLALGGLLGLEITGSSFGFGLSIQGLLLQLQNANALGFAMFHLLSRTLFALFRTTAVFAQLVPRRAASAAAASGGSECLVESLLH